MAGETQSGAAGAGITKDDLTAALKEIFSPLAEAIKTQGETLTVVAQNQGVLADTLKSLPPAGAAAAAAKEGEGKDAAAAAAAAAKPLSADEIKKLVADGVTAAQQQQQQTAEQLKKRDAFINNDESGLAKLAKNPIGKRYVDQLGSDESKWKDEAKSIVSQWENDAKASGVTIPVVGGANREGGQTTAADAAAAGANKGFLKMPGSPAAAQPAAAAATA